MPISSLEKPLPTSQIMRDDKVSITKGIGILLMVIAHAGLPEMFSRFIYMFHMPLFFFMSGYCFKEKYLSPPL